MRALQRFCEYEHVSTRLNFVSKSSRGQILRAFEILMNIRYPLNSYGSMQIKSNSTKHASGKLRIAMAACK